MGLVLWTEPFFEIPLEVFAKGCGKDEGLKLVNGCVLLVLSRMSRVRIIIICERRWFNLVVSGRYLDTRTSRVKRWRTLIGEELILECYRVRQSVQFQSYGPPRLIQGISMFWFDSLDYHPFKPLFEFSRKLCQDDDERYLLEDIP